MKDIEKIVNKGWSQLLAACDEAALILRDKVEFEFNIFYQPSDGPIIEHDKKVAPLGECVKVIKEKGKLTLEDYLRICI